MLNFASLASAFSTRHITTNQIKLNDNENNHQTHNPAGGTPAAGHSYSP